MAKIAVVSDPHLWNHKAFAGESKGGLNERARLGLATLRSAIIQAQEVGCEHFIVAGDLFDHWNVPPQLLSATMGVLGMSDMEIHLLRGNHDMQSFQPKDNALNALTWGGNIRVYEEPELNREIDVLFLPFTDPENRKEIKGEGGTLVLHTGIIADDTPEYLSNSVDAITMPGLLDVMAATGSRFAFAGHWHFNRQYMDLAGGRYVFQVGTLCPASFRPTEVGLSGFGNMYVFDSEKPDMPTKLMIAGPRFVDIRSEEDLQAVLNSPLVADHAFVRGIYRPGSGKELLDVLRANSHRLAGWEVVPDSKETQQQARELANRTVMTTGIEEAISEYVAAMPVGEGVERKEVQGKVTAHLEKAGG